MPQQWLRCFQHHTFRTLQENLTRNRRDCIISPQAVQYRRATPCSFLAMKLLKVINIAHLFGIIWFLSVVAFFVLAFVAQTDGGRYSPSQDTAFIYIVITGVIAFLGALLLYMVHILFFRKKPRHGTPGSVRRGIHPAFPIIIFFLLLLGAVSVFGAYNLGQADRNIDEVKTETPETAPSVKETVKYVDNDRLSATDDPVVACNVHESCGGGTKQLRQSVCSNSICCQVGNSWTFYEDKNRCLADQSSYNTTNNSQYVPCTVYGQTYNLTPEKCRYYQSEEASANKALNSDSYTPPTQYENSQQASTPIPVSQDKYHSIENDHNKWCDAYFKDYPDASKFKQECYR